MCFLGNIFGAGSSNGLINLGNNSATTNKNVGSNFNQNLLANTLFGSNQNAGTNIINNLLSGLSGKGSSAAQSSYNTKQMNSQSCNAGKNLNTYQSQNSTMATVSSMLTGGYTNNTVNVGMPDMHIATTNTLANNLTGNVLNTGTGSAIDSAALMALLNTMGGSNVANSGATAQTSATGTGNGVLGAVVGSAAGEVHALAEEVIAATGLGSLFAPIDAAVIHPILWDPISLLTGYDVSKHPAGVADVSNPLGVQR